MAQSKELIEEFERLEQELSVLLTKRFRLAQELVLQATNNPSTTKLALGHRQLVEKWITSEKLIGKILGAQTKNNQERLLFNFKKVNDEIKKNCCPWR